MERKLSADAPLTDPNDDAFGYALFAKHLSLSLRSMTPAEGFVVSLHAPWGYGKTTALNFIRHYLDQIPEGERPTVLPFNPWWFSGSEDVARRFFDQLLRELDRNGRLSKELRSKLAKFGEAISDVPLPFFSWAKVAKLVAPSEESLYDLKADLEGSLRSSEARIVVFVDDVDRLTADETRQLFRVIKAVVNLPGVIYILAFDKERVINALDEFHPNAGAAYLEKIVQVPFDLPLPDKASIRKLFFEKLNDVIRSVPEGRFDQVKWANLFFDGIDTFVQSPRDIARLVNALTVTFPAVENEVDVVEFIAIETLRVFAGPMYDAIRANRDFFAGHSSDYSDAAKVAAQTTLDAYLALLPAADRSAIQNVLIRLFPKVAALFGHGYHGAEWESIWRREKRAASSDIFDVYFRLAVAPGEISSSEMTAAIELMAHEEAFAEFLIRLSGEKHASGMNRARAFLSRLEDHTEEDVPLASVQPAVRALVNVADDLMSADPDTSGPFDFGMDIELGRVLRQLLLRLPAGDRFAILASLAHDSPSLWMIVREASMFFDQHDRRDDQSAQREPLLSHADAIALKRLALERIEIEAARGGLASAIELPRLLSHWAAWTNDSHVAEWVNGRLADREFVRRFVAQSRQVGHTWGMSDRAARRTEKYDLKWMARLVDLRALAAAVRQILDEEPDVPEHKAMRLFIDTVEGRTESDE